MNEPIISPLAVYLATRLDYLGLILAFASIGLFITLSIIFIGRLGSFDEDDVRTMKRLIIALIVVVGINAFIPTSKEAIAMYAASKITPANIEIAGETVDKATDKIVDKIIRIIDAAKKEEK